MTDEDSMNGEGKFYFCVGIGDGITGLSASDIGKDIIKFFGTGGCGGNDRLAQGGGLLEKCKYSFTDSNLSIISKAVILTHLYKAGKLTREELDRAIHLLCLKRSWYG